MPSFSRLGKPPPAAGNRPKRTHLGWNHWSPHPFLHRAVTSTKTTTVCFEHAAVTDLDESTSFFGVYDGHGSKVVAKFCAKHLHQQVLKNEAYLAGDIGTSLQKAFFRLL